MSGIGEILIADASALRAIGSLVGPANRAELFVGLTQSVEDIRFGFPKAVPHELKVIARDEPIVSWAFGLGSHLNPFMTDIQYMRPLTGLAVAMGYQEGFVSLSGREEPGIVSVGCLAMKYADLGRPFSVASEDVGEHPLCPTMEQLCEEAGWKMVGPEECLRRLGLDALIE